LTRRVQYSIEFASVAKLALQELPMAHAHGRIGGTNFRTDIEAGHHTLVADEGPALGGLDAGPAPYDILCAALCACTAITLRMYAERKGWALTACDVDVRFARDGDRASMTRVLRFEGALDAEMIARLADIAERTPVTLTLKQGLPITTSVAA
jgi:putative redox protein